MNEQNLEYLKKSLDYLGLGSKLNDVLETAIRKEMPKFTLGITSIYNQPAFFDKAGPKQDHIRFDLNFSRSNNTDMYFLNNYQVSLHKAGEPTARVQTFDLERDHRMTALQAYKLLSGQAFEKEIQPKAKEGAEQPEKVKVWFKLNLDVTDAYGSHPLNTFYPNYNYDLAESLSKYPLKGLDSEAKKNDALKTLTNGNLFETDLVVNKKIQPVMIAANPQMKTLDIYDKNRVIIRDDVIFPEKAAERAAQRVANKPGATASEQQPWEQEPGQDQQQSKNIGRK